MEFTGLADVYKQLVDWTKRLENETPFYQRTFHAIHAKTLLDVACGTGHHAAMFHRWGLHVEGADVDPGMIEQARCKFGEAVDLRWSVRSFDQPVAVAESFDVGICVGNSLALAPNLETATAAIDQLLKAVKPQGVVVLHVMNLWRLPDGPCHWQKSMRTQLPSGDAMVLKGVHRSGSQGFVNLVVTRLSDGTILLDRSARLLGLEAAQLERLVRAAGAKKVDLFGGYHHEPFDRQESVDIVLVARK